MAETPYTVNYEDERFKQVEADRTNKINETNNMYNGMIGQSDNYYQAQIDASKDWANTQTDLQNQQTDLAIEQINQQKDQANKDYTREQKGAYTDFQKQTNAYGANAEQMAASGLSNSGYSETSRVSMYNTYQNRYAMAKDSYNRAVLNYDNGIKEARLSNSSKLAEIAYQSLQTQLELSLQGFQYKNQLLLQQAEAVNKVNDTYYNRYQNVLQQINTENTMKEQIRQYNEKMAEERRQYNETMAFQKEEAKREQSNWEKQYALSKKASASSGSSGGYTLTNNNKTQETQLTQPVVTEKKEVNTTKTPTTKDYKSLNSALGTFIRYSGISGQVAQGTYASAEQARNAKGYSKSPMKTSELIKKGIIKEKKVNGKTYYY
jgi:hypothetical protein